MRKVLLVDDEPLILQGLNIIIDWGGRGLRGRRHVRKRL